MLERLPVQIDPFRFAEAGRMVRGKLALAGLVRLAPALASTDGELTVELEFGVDDFGIRFVQGTVGGELGLTCQRCLEPMRWPVDMAMAGALVRSEQEGERLPADYEPLLIESVPVRLADLIEDELLLSLPQVPMHPEQECPATELIRRESQRGETGTDTAETDDEGERENPFAILSELKRERD